MASPSRLYCFLGYRHLRGLFGLLGRRQRFLVAHLKYKSIHPRKEGYMCTVNLRALSAVHISHTIFLFSLFLYLCLLLPFLLVLATTILFSFPAFPLHSYIYVPFSLSSVFPPGSFLCSLQYPTLLFTVCLALLWPFLFLSLYVLFGHSAIEVCPVWHPLAPLPLDASFSQQKFIWIFMT